MTTTDKFAVYGPGNKNDELTLKETFIGSQAVVEWLNNHNCKGAWFVFVKPNDSYLWPRVFYFPRGKIILCRDEKKCNPVSTEEFVNERQECVAV
ncbi:MAG: hypothetical protein WCV41_02085 [Patescibacteria group bacterium]